MTEIIYNEQNSTKKSIIFDMDGTLFQTNKVLEISLLETFNYLESINEWNGEIPIEKYHKIMGAPLPKVWEILLPDHSQEVRKFTDSFFLKVLIENIKNGKGALYPHVEDVFSYLRDNNWSIFIASNGLKEYLKTIVSFYQLDNWIFDFYSIEEIESLDKSNLVEFILRKYNIQKGAIVGDRISDINAAKDNGLVSIGCNFDFAREEELSKADYVIDDLIELKSIIHKL
ncbi:adenosylhomocysteine nucleosidase [Tissierella praeacuta]|uniref:HAD hydrolase-like protein n=1 Tax=Tissierella praeacuta TaxID=43131 RepID=UPI001045BEBD|nr:HAD hydrolase-like protein [Tissierella praeacuta]TCU65631.1 adenosylhomocysteine nucleosidase [Tissierella praeacuta]